MSNTLKVTQKPWTLVSKEVWNRSFKWSTKHWFWSRDCKAIRGQSWRSKKISADTAGPGCIGLESGARADIFFDLQLWPLISLRPLDQNQCLVPQLKDLFHNCLVDKAQGFWMTFNECNLGSKKPYFNRAYVVIGGFGWTHLYDVCCFFLGVN